MKVLVRAAVALAVLAPLGVSAQGLQRPWYDMESTGSLGHRPGYPGWQYDTGSDQDRRPELAPWQQSGGQQTGGPARNRIPSDNFHISPR
jgi:hypothetical protein